MISTCDDVIGLRACRPESVEQSVHPAARLLLQQSDASLHLPINRQRDIISTGPPTANHNRRSMLRCALSVYDYNMVNRKPIVVNTHKLKQLEVLVPWAEDQPECRWESWAGPPPPPLCVCVCVRDVRQCWMS